MNIKHHTDDNDELTITSNKSILFLQNKRHMIKSVSRSMARSQRRTLNTKHLPIFNVFLSFFRFPLVDNHLGAETLEISNTTDVIHVPMREERPLHSCVL